MNTTHRPEFYKQTLSIVEMIQDKYHIDITEDDAKFIDAFLQQLVDDEFDFHHNRGDF